MHREVQGLGVVHGVDFTDYPNVEQYRGIPYGSIPARFRQATLVNSWKDGRLDGTAYGPICPYPKMAIGGSIVQKPLPPQHGYNMDEFKCLNLNITCPKKAPAPEEAGYPVVVFVHGGANAMGSGASTEYNGKQLVEFSVQKNLPLVSVTINYRLGAFGFLASDAIRTENEASGDTGVGNYGIRDQLLAYQWVKRYINAFGGDPSRVTANGESAGSIDTHIIMCSNLFVDSLPFTQAILQSGVAPLTVRTMRHHQSSYDKLLAHFKIESTLPPEGQLRALRDVAADDLVKGYVALGSPFKSWQAVVDNYLLKELPRFSTLSSVQYPASVKSLLLGDCAAEGLIFIDKVKSMGWDFDRVQALAEKTLGKKNSQEVLETFGIRANQTPEELLASIISLGTDAEWSQPIEAVARSFSNGDVFYYHMSQGNPFDGRHKGKAHHAVDLLYIFLTYQEHLPAELQQLAHELVEHWLVFISGGRPWTPYNVTAPSSAKIMHYGSDARVREELESAKPAYNRLRLCAELQDSISNFAAALRGEEIII
ncbi:hypothetical protein CLAIMM_01455 [Cladophialophora immunda]|nr:hypothetical protein CLAIMM_01455 [Cladophialophora immunda]